MEMNRIKNSISYLPVIGFLFLIASLPFYYGWFQRAALYILGVSYVIDYVINQRWKDWHWSKNKWVYVAFIGFFLLIPLRQCCDENITSLFSKTIQNYLPFLIFGICGIIGITNKWRMEYATWIMLLTSIVVLSYVLRHVGLPDWNNYNIWCLSFNQILHQNVNTHMVLNLYWNISIILSLFVGCCTCYSKWIRYGTLMCMIFPLFLVSVTDGRTGLLTLVGIILILILYMLYRYRRWWIGLLTIAFLICAYIALMQHGRFVDAANKTNPRVYIWEVALDMIREKPLLGYGVCSSRLEFVERGLKDEDFYNSYAQYLQQDFIKKGKPVDMSVMHPHNALLETWIQFGIVGVLILCVLIVLSLTMHLGKYQLFLNLCIFAFLLQSIFESLGNELKPIYFCLLVLLWHSQYINSQCNNEQASFQPR